MARKTDVRFLGFGVLGLAVAACGGPETEDVASDALSANALRPTPVGERALGECPVGERAVGERAVGERLVGERADGDALRDPLRASS
jgi:hypothetical protein